MSKKSPNEALLQLSTKTEVNSSHFRIERSADAVNFVAIGQQNAAGNSNTEKRYSYIDAKVLQGNNYYRLKQVYKNGRFVYTPTRMVSFDALTAASVKLYPNPATNVAYMLLSPGLINKHMVIKMMDIKGNVVKQWKLPNNAQPQLQLNQVGLPKGT